MRGLVPAFYAPRMMVNVIQGADIDLPQNRTSRDPDALAIGLLATANEYDPEFWAFDTGSSSISSVRGARVPLPDLPRTSRPSSSPTALHAD